MNQPVRHSNSWTARFKNGKDMQFVFQASVFQGINWKNDVPGDSSRDLFGMVICDLFKGES